MHAKRIRVGRINRVVPRPGGQLDHAGPHRPVQDQTGQALSYKFGSLTHSDKATRDQAVAHNLKCIGIGEKLGSKALTVWIADLDDVIAMKRAAGRPKDLLAIEHLGALREELDNQVD